MKKVIFVLLLILIWGNVCVFARSDKTEAEKKVLEEYSRLYGEEIERGTSELKNSGIDELMPDFDAGELLGGIAEGKTFFSVSAVTEKILELLFGEIKNTVRMLAVILTVALLCTYLTGIYSNLNGRGASEAAFFVCYLVVSGVSAAALMELVGCGKALVDNISVFMRLLVPVIMLSLTSSGAPVTASAFEMVMIGVIEVTEWIIESFFIPLLMMSAALGLVNNLSDSINSEKLVQFMNKTVKWGIGIAMTVFVGIMNLQGIVSGSADVLAVKVTKFATSNLIPVVGGALSETVETVINCGAVIKNSVGVLGIIMVILMAAIPILKIAACLIMFRLCAAVLQPVSDKRLVKCVSDVADVVAGIFGLVAAVTVMFVIMLTIVINIVT